VCAYAKKCASYARENAIKNYKFVANINTHFHVSGLVRQTYCRYQGVNVKAC